MRRIVLLALAILLAVVSGCGTESGSSNTQPQPLPPKAEAQAAQDVKAAPAQGAAESAPAAPDAAKPAEAAAKAEPAASERPKPAASQAAASASGTSGATPPVAAPATDGDAPAVPAASDAHPAAPSNTAPAPAEQPPQASAPAADAKKTELTISIIGDKKHGVILKERFVPYQEGTTVMDVLKQVTKENKIQMEFQGKGSYAYVQGIDNLYEFDGGPKSGWIFKVNGRAPGEGAGSYKPAAGDRIEWLYTLNLGEDVGAVKK